MTTEQKRKADEARREYHRQWRAKNKEKVQRYNAEYWLKKVAQAESAKDQEGV